MPQTNDIPVTDPHTPGWGSSFWRGGGVGSFYVFGGDVGGDERRSFDTPAVSDGLPGARRELVRQTLTRRHCS